MKTILFLVLLISTTTFAANFKVTKDCRQTIKHALEKRNLELTKINFASFSSGGSDGASSWDSEYIIGASVKDKRGNSIKVLISIEDDYSCRVMAVNKAY